MSVWLAEAWRFFALLAVFYLPGFVLAHIVHNRQGLFLRLAIAPAWTAGIVGLLTIIYGEIDVAWTVWSALPGFAIAFALAIAARALFPRSGEATPTDQRSPRWWQPALAALIFGLIAGLPILTTIPPDGIVQGGDSQFHIGLLWQIEHDGVASPLSASAAMMGLDRHASFYPTAWHAMSALATSGSQHALTTANVMLLVAPVLWIFSTMALTWALTKDQRTMWWALAACALVPMALIRLELITTLWPFVVGMSIMPGALAMLVAQLREVRGVWRTSPGRVALMAACWTIPALGLAIFHPSTFLPAAAAIWLCAIVVALQRLWRCLLWREFARLTAWLGGLAFLIIGPQLVYNSPYASLLQLHREPQVSFKGIPAKLIAAVKMSSLDGALSTAVFHVAVLIISVCAAVTIWWWRRNYRFLVVAWVAQVLLVLACLFPVPIFNRLTSLYYNVAVRALVGEAVFLVPMLAVAATVWASALACRTTRRGLPAWKASALVFLVATSLSFYENARAAHQMVYPNPGDVRFLASQPEIAMIKRAKSLPEDAFILGDPAAGASFLEVVAGRRVVFPYPGLDFGEENTLLVQHFRDIHFNPEVCHIVRKHGITHFYADRPGWYNSSFTSERRPGLYHVDTTRGFTLIDRGGTASLYRIDMCTDPTWVYDAPPPPPRPGDFDPRPGHPSIL
ncbi:DUF6541 family protein [Trueperella pyogenes]|uniref:DUF6541 family protein n=1 Tax=Trueperella pyogenes TaxID=1661 RepID=UPI00345C83E7